MPAPVDKKYNGYHAYLPIEMSGGFKQLGICDHEFATQGNKHLKQTYGYDVVLSVTSQKVPRSSKYVKRLSAHFYDDEEVHAGDIEAALIALECIKSPEVSVLVHCRYGINRSSAVVTAWAIRHGGLCKQVAIDLLEKAKKAEAADWASFDGKSGMIMRGLMDEFVE